jgi:hypothetical protein
MLVNGEPCNSSTSYLAIYRGLRKVAGIASWFTEFRPIRFPAREFIHLLMLEFLRINICCFMSGSFVCFLAGILRSLKAITMHVVLTDIPDVVNGHRPHLFYESLGGNTNLLDIYCVLG